MQWREKKNENRFKNICVCVSQFLTLCHPMDYSLLGSSVHGISQARILEWVFSSPGDLPNPGIEPRSRALQVDSLLSEPSGRPSRIIMVKSTDYSIGCRRWQSLRNQTRRHIERGRGWFNINKVRDKQSIWQEICPVLLFYKFNPKCRS